MATSSAGNQNPYDDYLGPRADPDLIDPDDLDINDLDDPLENEASDRQPLTAAARSAANAVPGEDRRAPIDTIDETVWETLSRDLNAIWEKMKQVLWPRFTWTKWPDADTVLNNSHTNEIRDWDLWGPLLSALLLSLLLSIAASDEQTTSVFSGVFAIVWIGEALVTLQIRLLGGNISFFQSVCVIGYTLFPLVGAALLSAVNLHPIIRVPLYIFFFLWSLAAGVSILGGSGVDFMKEMGGLLLVDIW
ncbi:hypothetical protein H072_9539 [Dactylellina haptotyla CBS 200.50]|uniref:Protein YIP n=1 Tax=Dactylellina haptotyla (strain CBS 200.50) TaxID=1284197 RepID=S8BP27_DACHA|nr:hypothetical protein H072_9539 [Dactylellina haptotyla CBS 200.50]